MLLTAAFRAIVALPLLLGVSADVTPVCSNATGMADGRFYTFWHDSGSGCLTLRGDGAYTVAWDLGERGNLVAGTGWARGSARRAVHYRADAFDPGSNGYLTLYGWSRDPLVEYYVVDNWGDFTPPGDAATPFGTVDSDGGTYRIYRTQRVQQPSIAGVATFFQYWSVRTEKRAVGQAATITFANHVAAWRAAGLKLGTLDYQVLATEGFGSAGHSDIALLAARGP